MKFLISYVLNSIKGSKTSNKLNFEHINAKKN